MWRAADELARRGETVSVRRIRAALGGGSHRQITPALRAWRDARAYQEVEDIPPALLGALRRFVREVRQVVGNEYEISLAELREARRRYEEAAQRLEE